MYTLTILFLAADFGDVLKAIGLFLYGIVYYLGYLVKAVMAFFVIIAKYSPSEIDTYGFGLVFKRTILELESSDSMQVLTASLLVLILLKARD